MDFMKSNKTSRIYRETYVSHSFRYQQTRSLKNTPTFFKKSTVILKNPDYSLKNILKKHRRTAVVDFQKKKNAQSPIDLEDIAYIS